jgi:hypothetical protein
MNFYTVTRDPYLERLPTQIDHTYGVQTYDLDNLYPQRADSVCSRSYTAKRAVERTADFIYGQGFQDPVISKLVVNSDRQTLNKILSIICKDKALYTGFALHIKYDLNFKIAEITPLDFMFCRLGFPDDRGNVSEIKYHVNWEQNYRKTLNMVFDPETYPVFNPDPKIIQGQMLECGGWQNYPGQILYWTPKQGIYPKCSFDPVFDNAQAQSEIGIFELASLQNGFTASTIFKYPGKFEDEEKKLKFVEKMNDHKGAYGANSIMVVENPSGEALDLIEKVQMDNTDKIHEFTSKNIKNAIRESMAVPAPIMAQMPENGMFNKEQINEAYIYFNDGTSKHRNEICEVLQDLFQFWKQPVAVSSWAITPLQYGGQNTSSSVSTPTQPGQPAPGANGQPVAERKVDASLSKLSAAESMNLERILRKVKKGKITREEGIALLKMTYGFTDDEVKAFIQ